MRLTVGVLLAIVLSLIGLALAVFVIPPLDAGRTSFVFLRASMIGAGSGIAALIVWSVWSARWQHVVVIATLALVGGLAGALSGHALAVRQYGDSSIFDQAFRIDRIAIIGGVAGANLLPAIYSGVRLVLPGGRH